MKYDVLIIGGGAAGLTAALSASENGAKTAVVEAASRVGRKILASGNGRCNLANVRPQPYPGGAPFARQVLSLRDAEQVLAFFHRLGLVTVEEEGGRVYPGCGQAAAVLDVLRFSLEKRGVPLICEAPAEKMEKGKQGFRVTTPQGVFESKTVVAACGGMAGGKLGHDGGPYRLLTQWGHTLEKPFPALCPLTAEKSAVKGLAGLRLPAILTLWNGEKTVARPSQGEALFTDYGVSGVCAMELARYACVEKKKTGRWPILYMDFSPMLGIAPRQYGFLPEKAGGPDRHLPAVKAFLEERLHRMPAEELLRGMAPRLLGEKLRGLHIGELARSLAMYPVPLTGVKGMEAAQVTAGGIAVEEFDGSTLQSLMVPGLFAAGEIMNVDGACGGYNLLFAFASGLIAGENAALWKKE